MISLERFGDGQRGVGRIERFVRKGIAWDGWENYVSLCEHPKFFSTIRDNPLIVVHPGFRLWWPGEKSVTPRYDRIGYNAYLERVREKVAQSVEVGRTIIVYLPSMYRQEALDAIGNPEGALLVPTTNDGGAIIDHGFLGERAREFHDALVAQITSAEICGEYRDRCVQEVCRYLDGVEITRVSD